MSPEASHITPRSVILKGTSLQGPLELEIPVQIRKEPDEMIHQLAARKATKELEEGHGWISEARNENGDLIRTKYPAQFELLQRREAVRLGVEFQVGGKYCSFVAVETNEAEIAEKRKKAFDKSTKKASLDNNGNTELEDWEIVELEQNKSAAKLKYAISEMEAEEEEDLNYSDEDMGFGLFDYPNTPPRPATTKATPKTTPATKEECGEEEEQGTLLQRLIKRQSFEGSWAHDNLPYHAMGISGDAVQASIKRLASTHGLDDVQTSMVVATAVVIDFLEKKLESEEDTWELIVEKAREWLEGALSPSILALVWNEAKGIVGE